MILVHNSSEFSWLANFQRVLVGPLIKLPRNNLWIVKWKVFA